MMIELIVGRPVIPNTKAHFYEFAVDANRAHDSSHARLSQEVEVIYILYSVRSDNGIGYSLQMVEQKC